MSCDFNGRDELRRALLKSTLLLPELMRTVQCGAVWNRERVALVEQQIEENKRVLKEEAATRPPLANPETCPTNGTL